MVTDYEFFATESPDAKLNINIDGKRSDIHARGKSLTDRNLLKNYFNKRTVLATGVKKSKRTIFFPEVPNELCERIRLIIQEKPAEIDAKICQWNVDARIDELLY